MLGVEKRVGDTDIFDCLLIILLISLLVYFLRNMSCICHISRKTIEYKWTIKRVLAKLFLLLCSVTRVKV
jgi:hypothetical protein